MRVVVVNEGMWCWWWVVVLIPVRCGTEIAGGRVLAAITRTRRRWEQLPPWERSVASFTPPKNKFSHPKEAAVVGGIDTAAWCWRYR